MPATPISVPNPVQPIGGDKSAEKSPGSRDPKSGEIQDGGPQWVGARKQKQKANPENPEVPGRLICYLFGVSCLTLATFGLQEVCMNVPARLIQHYINHSIIYDFDMYVDQLSLSGLWGAIIAMMPIGAAIGAAMAPILADFYGRKPSLFLIAPIISVFGAILMYVSHYKILFELLIVGRLISGISIGITTTTLPMYLIECTPVHSRGLTCSFQSIAIHIVMTLAFVLSLPMFLGSKKLWGFLLGIQGVPALLTLVLYPIMMETPCFLYTKRGNRSKCIQNIIRLQGDLDEKEIDDILFTFEQEMEHMKTQLRIKDIFRDPSLCRAAALAVLIGAMRSISGAPIVHSYSTALFEDVGVPEDAAEYGSLVMGIGVFFTLLSSQIVDKVGRRPLYLSCMGWIVINWVLVYMFQNFKQSKYIPWASLCIILFTFVVVYPLGPGSLSWYLASELVPVSARATMAGLSIMTLWVAMLLSVSIFPALRSSLGEANTTMVQFLVPVALGFIVLCFTLPETRQKAPERILRSLSTANINSETENSDMSKSQDPINSPAGAGYGTMSKDDLIPSGERKRD